MKPLTSRSATINSGAAAGLRSFEFDSPQESAEKRTSASLSVIVPVYNEQFLIESSLARLEILGESSLLERIKVIVVDDGSEDDTPAAIARFRERCESRNTAKFSWFFTRQEKNSGKGAAIRTGLVHVEDGRGISIRRR
jgi:glycosyltransferase involved in cell wall biosynthesis